MATEDLTGLRESIAEIDRALLELLRRRMELAARVGAVKAATGQPVVVRDVEDRVLGRARLHAESCGVSEEMMAQVFQAIMDGSVERQHRVGINARTKVGRNVLVLGGAGDMGAWFSRFLPLAGHRVAAVDPAWRSLPAEPGHHASLDQVDDLDAFDAFVVAVPLAATPAVIDELVDRQPRGLVVEIASIKSHVEPAIRRARERGIAVSALHPMFGPGKPPYQPLTFVLACLDDADVERRRIAALLDHPYSDVVAVPFAHHDRLMGWLLGLAHLSAMVFGAALTRSGLDPRELQACASTTFARQSATALSVLSEDPSLYLDIQRLNPHRDEIYRAAAESLAELESRVAAGDLAGFASLLAAARRAVSPEP